ncbi:hypothetical protein [Sphingobacterium bovistauri]|uniref:Anti-sigma factor n=1 Tax=Sphingobacterium bovistauri TaxID=2781959 RepID=A0ABS7Z4D0_9SPHI|nr:hypothetical protein [Sphingobacterium bovistauri]MCA5005041.1 hypothetical protein [Sphingobacterium bovistauri]
MENNYQLSRIHNYVHGLMSRDEMHALEREALEDPFLQDAIDGYKLQQGVDAKQLSILQQRLATRVQEQATNKNRRFYSWQRLAIGMAAGVMFMIVCTLILMRYLPQQRTATLTEVVVNESTYDYKITPNNNSSDAIPVDGWGKLYNQLSSNYSNSEEFQGTLYITFKIDNNQRAFNISVEGKDGVKYDELKDIIRNKIKWKGTQGAITLDVWEVGAYEEI